MKRTSRNKDLSEHTDWENHRITVGRSIEEPVAKWICTDPSTNQWGRQLSDIEFEFKEDRNAGPIGYYEHQEIIDLRKYTLTEKEDIINSYGYTFGKPKKGLVNVFEQYGQEAAWIIAECVFEMT